MAFFTVLAMAVVGGAGPARADTTGFAFEFDEPSAPHAVGTCNNLYCATFPYGVWSPTWELRVYPAPGGTPTPVQVQWEVIEVKPADPKHLVSGIDLQIDMGHSWQEAPDGPTGTVTIPSTATYSSPYVFYFRFKPIVDAQQAIRVCATMLWKGAPTLPSSPEWGNNSCTDDLSFTGTPPQGRPTSASSAAHTSPTSPGRSTSPVPSATTTTAAGTPTTTTTTTPIPTAANSAADATPALPANDAPSSNSLVAAPAASASQGSAAWKPVLFGGLGFVIVGGATATVLARRRRGRA